MEILLIIIFVIGYLAIALEHPIKIDKAASALVMGGIIWGALALGIDDLVTKEFLSEFYEKFKTKFNSLKEIGVYSSDEYAKPIKFLKYELSHHLVDIGEILFFLLAAMTIVELVDSHQGFSIITDKITTKRKVPLMWILCVAIPCVLVTIAPRFIPAAEVNLFFLLETIIGPIWVWLIIKEQPSLETLQGGLIIITTIAIHSYLKLKNS